MKIFWTDIETSGLDPDLNGIIQLAYKIEIAGDIKEEGILYSNCAGKNLSSKALEVNGFSPSEINSFPSPVEMYETIISLLDKYINKYDKTDKFTIAGYNVNFDIKFMHRLFLDNDNPYFYSYFSFGVIDPSQIIRFLEYAGFPFPTKLTLIELAKLFNLQRENAHDAMVDIEMTIDIVRDLKKLLQLDRILEELKEG